MNQADPFKCLNCGSTNPPEPVYRGCKDYYLKQVLYGRLLSLAVSVTLFNNHPSHPMCRVFYEAYPVHQKSRESTIGGAGS